MKLEKVLQGITTLTYISSLIGMGLSGMAVQEGRPGGEFLLYINEGAMILSGSILAGSFDIRNKSDYQDY